MNFFLLILSSVQSFCHPKARTSKLVQGPAMSYTNLISQKNSARRTRLGPRWLVFAVGLGKENFWLDRRSSRDPSRKGEHIRKPYSAAKIISISPGAMPPFTLETHTINAKLNLPILPKGVFCGQWAQGLLFSCKKHLFTCWLREGLGGWGC